jgi:hypothetical protein
LFGLQQSKPVDATVACDGSANQTGTLNDPLVGKRIGGINVFGGGLAIYSNSKTCSRPARAAGCGAACAHCGRFRQGALLVN